MMQVDFASDALALFETRVPVRCIANQMKILEMQHLMAALTVGHGMTKACLWKCCAPLN